MIARYPAISSFCSMVRIVFLVAISASSSSAYACRFTAFQDSTQPTKTEKKPGDTSAEQDDHDKSEEIGKRPLSGDEREPRDESGLPDDAFNPMKLYEGKGADEVGPTIKPGEVGIVRWPYLTVHVKEKYIDIEGVIGINDGYLEQVACTPGTRGYESLVIVFARPSYIHAALLLLGLEPGKPGRWEAVAADADHAKVSYRVVGPVGDKVKVTVLYRKVAKKVVIDENDEVGAEEAENGDEGVPGNHVEKTEEQGEMVEVPVQDWIMDINTGKRFPEGAWVFGGSRMKKDFTDTDRYVADLSGSIVGLVTFGDEVLGWNEVWPDEEAVLEPEWVCNTEVMPAWNAKVVLRLRVIGDGD